MRAYHITIAAVVVIYAALTAGLLAMFIERLP